MTDIRHFQEQPWPSILAEGLTAPNPEALALQAIEEAWTVEQVRVEAAQQHEPYRHVVMDCPCKCCVVQVVPSLNRE